MNRVGFTEGIFVENGRMKGLETAATGFAFSDIAKFRARPTENHRAG